MFDAVPISVAFVSAIEAVVTASVVQRFRTINEKYRVINVVFLTQFTEERVSDNVFLVVSSFVCGNLFVFGSTASYSQYRSSLSWITVSSTAT